jgi:hypothetical protein
VRNNGVILSPPLPGAALNECSAASMGIGSRAGA